MRKALAVFMPGEFAARRIDKGHAKFIKEIKKETSKGSATSTMEEALVQRLLQCHDRV